MVVKVIKRGGGGLCFRSLAVHSHTAFDFHETMYNAKCQEGAFSSRLLQDPLGETESVLNDSLGEPPV